MTKRTPPHLKLLRGNPGKKPIRESRPTPGTSQPPAPPTYLCALGAEEWRRTAPELWRRGLLTELDVSTFAVYCAAFGRWRLAIEAAAEAEKMTITTDTGLRVHPLVTAANVLGRDVLKFAAAFGLTPVSRHQIGGAEPVGSKFDGLLA